MVQCRYVDQLNHSLNDSTLACTPWGSFFPTETSARTRRLKKPGLSLVVVGASGGILRKIAFIRLSGKSHFFTTVYISDRTSSCIPLWLGHDPLYMCRRVV